jgi:hypothetical protein
MNSKIEVGAVFGGRLDLVCNVMRVAFIISVAAPFSVDLASVIGAISSGRIMIAVRFCSHAFYCGCGRLPVF